MKILSAGLVYYKDDAVASVGWIVVAEVLQG